MHAQFTYQKVIKDQRVQRGFIYIHIYIYMDLIWMFIYIYIWIYKMIYINMCRGTIPGDTGWRVPLQATPSDFLGWNRWMSHLLYFRFFAAQAASEDWISSPWEIPLQPSWLRTRKKTIIFVKWIEIVISRHPKCIHVCIRSYCNYLFVRFVGL